MKLPSNLAARTASDTKDSPSYHGRERISLSRRELVSGGGPYKDQAHGLTQPVFDGDVMRLLQRSLSDGCSKKDEHSSMTATHSRTLTSLKALRPAAQRHASSPSMQLRSRYHDPAISAATLQETLRDRIQFSGSQRSGSSPLHPTPIARHASGEDTSLIMKCVIVPFS